MSQLFQELKRRNVFRVAIAYVAVSWVVLQVADIVLENIAAPAWLMQALMFFMLIGFVFALFFAWAFELTPEGIKKEADVDRSVSMTGSTGKKLDRVIIAVLGVAVAFLLADKFWLKDDTPPEAEAEKSVAVLPFVAMSRGPDDEYFADGLTEEILNSLTRLPALLVTARTSSFHFKGQDLPIPEIAATLGVAHVVEGSVRRDGGRLRITAQLIRAADGFHLWSENYDRDSNDTFAVQTDIAEKIAAALDVVMDEEQREKMLTAGVRNPEAFVAYQKGVELFIEAHGSATMLETLKAATDRFDEAVAIEPGFAEPYLWGADYFTHVLMDSFGGKEISDEQRKNAYQNVLTRHEHAIRYASSESIRAVAAFDRAVIAGNWRAVPALMDEYFARSGCTSASWIMEMTIPYGRTKDTLEDSLRETECDPIAFSGWTRAITAYNYLGDHDAAIEMAQQVLDATPHIRIYQQLVISYVAAGRFDEAEAVIDRHIHADYQSLPLRVTTFAARGDAQSAKSVLDRLMQVQDTLPRPSLAQLAQTGDREAANKLAAEIDALPHGHLILMTYPNLCRCGAPFDLEATPNFAKLIKDANLPWPPASPIDWPLKDW